MTNRAIIVFIKNPILGTAKTRLAKSIGNEKALQVYRQLLNITREKVSALEAERYLYYNSFIDSEDEWSSEKFQKRLQASGDLGIRMVEAFQEVTSQSKKTIIVGSDCPTITSELLESAFETLNKSDVVIGPSPDGGYYLLGMNKFHPELFENINWSTDSVLQQTIEIASKGNLSVGLLPDHNDIDTIDDWEQYCRLTNF